jgi:hypothetical protein
LDPDPSLFVRIWILPSSKKNSKKNLVFDFFMTFYLLKKIVNMPSKSNKEKNLEVFFCPEGHWKIAGSGSGPGPDH